MSLVAIKLMLSKAWIFTKNYWYIPFVLIVFSIAAIMFRSNNEKMIQMLKNSIQNYEKEINILKESHKKEMEMRDELLDQYNDIIGELEKQYQDKQEELDDKKKEEVKELVKKYENDNETLAKELSEKFGVNYVSD
jgi:predicted membrane protein